MKGLPLNEVLKYLGVKTVFCGAGSRNSNLLNQFTQFEVLYELNEQAMAFKALGMAKFTNEAIAICITSGTAVAQCLPAIIEAYYSEVPLIIISADRPARLRNSHAPQAIDQVDIFTKFVRQVSSSRIDEVKISSHDYPIHINIEIEISNSVVNQILTRISKQQLTSLININKNILAVFTEGHECSEQLEIIKVTNIPFYIECTSSLKRNQYSNRVFYEKSLYKMLKRVQGDEFLILKFGSTPFSKLWRDLDDQYSSVKVISIGSDKTGLSRGQYCEELEDGITPKQEMICYNSVDNLDLHNLLDQALVIYPKSEISIFHSIYQTVLADETVYVGNSMPIRYWQMIDRKNNKVIANRGANGIDGQVATAIGIALKSMNKVHCILGDLTFLYDLCSCIDPLPKNLIIHVINNHGGRIFERIDVNKSMILEHDKNIQQLINGFSSKGQIQEYFPDNQQTKEFWDYWDKL